MKPSEGYEQMDAAGEGAVTDRAGIGEAIVTDSNDHIVLGGKPVTSCSSQSSGDLQGVD